MSIATQGELTVQNVLSTVDAVQDAKGVVNAAMSQPVAHQQSGGTQDHANANKPNQIPNPNEHHGDY